jgi:hypothetical protein
VRSIPSWKTELIEGEPIQVGQRQLIPVIRMRSVVRRQVTFGTQESSGGGGGLVWLRPVAVIERQPDGSEKHIPILDASGTAIKGMLLGALALPLLYLFAVSLVFLWRYRSTKTQA